MRGGGEGRLAATVSAEKTAEADLETRAGAKQLRFVFPPSKEGPSGSYVSPFILSCNCGFLFAPGCVIFFFKGEWHHFSWFGQNGTQDVSEKLHVTERTTEHLHLPCNLGNTRT